MKQLFRYLFPKRKSWKDSYAQWIFETLQGVKPE